jgi:hypothetical protein
MNRLTRRKRIRAVEDNYNNSKLLLNSCLYVFQTERVQKNSSCLPTVPISQKLNRRAQHVCVRRVTRKTRVGVLIAAEHFLTVNGVGGLIGGPQAYYAKASAKF